LPYLAAAQQRQGADVKERQGRCADNLGHYGQEEGDIFVYLVEQPAPAEVKPGQKRDKNAGYHAKGGKTDKG
jgi:hypothetical protein